MDANWLVFYDKCIRNGTTVGPTLALMLLLGREQDVLEMLLAL